MMDLITSEVVRIKEAIRQLKEMKNLNQYHLLGGLESFVEDYEKGPTLDRARDIVDYKYRHESLDSDEIFGSIYNQELAILGTKTTLDHLLGKLRNAIIKSES